MPRTVGAFNADDGRLLLYQQGLNDYEIAEKLYLHQTSVFGWRKRRGLIANGGAGIGGRRLNSQYQKGVNFNVKR